MVSILYSSLTCTPYSCSQNATVLHDYSIVHHCTCIGQILHSSMFISPIHHLFSRLNASKYQSHRTYWVPFMQTNTEWASIYQIMEGGAQVLWRDGIYQQDALLTTSHLANSPPISSLWKKRIKLEIDFELYESSW